MITLLYRDYREPGGVSKFDDAILRVAREQRIRIACPYLDLGYLQRILNVCASWQLLTDLEAWLRSQGRKERRRILHFLEQNEERVRHLVDLHAKVVIGSGKAVIGSANLTEQGIQRRLEVGVLLEDEERTHELVRWFDAHWGKARKVDRELRRAARALLQEPVTAEVVSRRLDGRIRMRPARLLPLGPAPDEEDLLVERLRSWGNRSRAQSYLDLAGVLLEQLKIRNDDPRLTMSLRKKKSPTVLLPISVNRRYVLAGEKDGAILLILGRDSYRKLRHRVARAFSFDAHAKEPTSAVPCLVRVRAPKEARKPLSLLDGWLRAARRELERGKKSPYRRHHSPAYYRAVRDLGYRRKLLDRAFGGSS
ncbi:MAG: hypothetical protein KatS3mg076_1559 [Candidatus Binatia bacterium]|nr:MAG: hypothetical protein KatS3mg076_1559 [Candidatus Binatia bacterium]